MNQWFKKYYTLCFNCIIWYQFLEFDLSYERISIIARLLYMYCNIHHVIPKKLNIKFNIWWYLWFILYLMYKRIFLMSKSILSIDYNTVTVLLICRARRWIMTEQHLFNIRHLINYLLTIICWNLSICTAKEQY